MVVLVSRDQPGSVGSRHIGSGLFLELPCGQVLWRGWILCINIQDLLDHWVPSVHLHRCCWWQSETRSNRLSLLEKPWCIQWGIHHRYNRSIPRHLGVCFLPNILRACFNKLCSVFNTAAFAIGGPDFIANCAPEAENPRRNIPKAVRRVIYRLIVFFILSVFAVGLLVPYNDPTMRTYIHDHYQRMQSRWYVFQLRLLLRVMELPSRHSSSPWTD